MPTTVELYITSPVYASNDIRARISAALLRAYSAHRHTAKLLARATGRTPRAVQGWLYGQNAPPADALIDLCAECDELAAEINLMIEERRRACGRG
jgi:hypothetical protein